MFLDEGIWPCYQDSNELYASTFFNSTVPVLDPVGVFDTQTFFMYIALLGLVAGGMHIGLQATGTLPVGPGLTFHLLFLRLLPLLPLPLFLLLLLSIDPLRLLLLLLLPGSSASGQGSPDRLLTFTRAHSPAHIHRGDLMHSALPPGCEGVFEKDVRRRQEVHGDGHWWRRRAHQRVAGGREVI
jgi:hypothetical protein